MDRSAGGRSQAWKDLMELQTSVSRHRGGKIPVLEWGKSILRKERLQSQAARGAGDEGPGAGGFLGALLGGGSHLWGLGSPGMEWYLWLLLLLIAPCPSAGQAGRSWSAWLPRTPGSQGDAMPLLCPVLLFPSLTPDSRKHRLTAVGGPRENLVHPYSTDEGTEAQRAAGVCPGPPSYWQSPGLPHCCLHHLSWNPLALPRASPFMTS